MILKAFRRALLACAIAACAFAAAPPAAAGPGAPVLRALPDPTGPFAIGTALVDWVDVDREETWTDDPHDRRRLVVQFWYPAESRNTQVHAPYVVRHDRIAEALDTGVRELYPVVTTHAGMEAPVRPASADLGSLEPLREDPRFAADLKRVANPQARYPVVLLSHGMNSSRVFYSALAQDLASHGFVVAAIEHPHWSAGVAYSDGRAVGFAYGAPAIAGLTADQLDEITQEGTATMAEDQAFVARMLARLGEDQRFVVRELGRQLDLARIAVVGHGMGGMAAVRSLYSYATIHAGATLDGYAWAGGGLAPHGSPPTPCAKPLLVMLAGGIRGDSLAFARRHLDAFRSPSVVELPAALHGSFTDHALLDRAGAGVRAGEALGTHRTIAACLRAFLDDHLRARGSFDATLASMPGASRIALPQVLEAGLRSATR